MVFVYVYIKFIIIYNRAAFPASGRTNNDRNQRRNRQPLRIHQSHCHLQLTSVDAEVKKRAYSDEIDSDREVRGEAGGLNIRVRLGVTCARVCTVAWTRPQNAIRTKHIKLGGEHVRLIT
jgi:hypothetical protein